MHVIVSGSFLNFTEVVLRVLSHSRDVMTQTPRGRNAKIIDRWMFVRYFAVGLYIGVATVLSSIWWFMYYSGGMS